MSPAVVMSDEGGAAMAVEANPRDARAVKRVVKSILKTSWERRRWFGGNETNRPSRLFLPLSQQG